MSGSSKGVTVKELVSFFPYFQVWQSYVDMEHKYLLFDGAGSCQGSRTQMDSKYKDTPFYVPIWIVPQFACLKSLSW